MNEERNQQFAALFPRGSKDFFDINPQLRPSQRESDSGSALGGEAPGKAEVQEVPRVCIIMYRVRLLDKDNAYASAKILVDCLCEAGLITDDSPSDIDLKVTQKKVKHRNEQRTEVRIVYP